MLHYWILLSLTISHSKLVDCMDNYCKSIKNINKRASDRLYRYAICYMCVRKCFLSTSQPKSVMNISLCIVNGVFGTKWCMREIALYYRSSPDCMSTGSVRLIGLILSCPRLKKKKPTCRLIRALVLLRSLDCRQFPISINFYLQIQWPQMLMRTILRLLSIWIVIICNLAKC